MSELERRRRRPAVSCILCRKRKIRCNRETPCSNCVRSKNADCVYDSLPSLPRPKHWPVADTNGTKTNSVTQGLTPTDSHSSTGKTLNLPKEQRLSTANTSTRASSTAGQSIDPSDFANVRASQTGGECNETTLRPLASGPDSNIETTTSGLGGTFHVHHERRSPGRSQGIIRGVTHKTRVFGQSHWINGIVFFKDISDMIEPILRGGTTSCVAGIQKCKSLARVIKSQRTPPWPSPPTSDLPTKEIADALVDGYLRTYETVYRILHIPTFKRDYQALWLSNAKRDPTFLVQLKLVLAIGATTYDENFSLRPSATQWVYEAQTWLSEPTFKSRVGIQFLQTNLLLLLAREAVGVGEDSVWISAGALVRTAVYMGLHRDPSHLPARTLFASEMRRRLWNTALQIALQASLNSGAPPLVSLDDFDTGIPGNFDDDQLLDEGATPKSDEEFTQTSVAIALRKTFAERLAVTKWLNDIAPHRAYEDMLRVDTALRASYKQLYRTLQACSANTSSAFAVRTVEFILNRYLSSLHIPSFGAGLHDTAHAYSRKVVVETSLKTWCAACPSSSIIPAQPANSTAPQGADDLVRLTACGAGFFRTAAFQAAHIIAVELRAQLREAEGLGPTPVRADLLSVVNEARDWSLRCIEAGETNVKGYLIMCLVGAQIRCLLDGTRSDEIPALLVKAAEEAEDRCLHILERMVATSRPDGGADSTDQSSLDPKPVMFEDWDMMMSDSWLDSGNAQMMNWLFDSPDTHESTLW